MSFCHTGVSNLRPVRRLKIVLCAAGLLLCGAGAQAADGLVWSGSATESLLYGQYEKPLSSRFRSAPAAGNLRVELKPAVGSELMGRELLDRLMAGKLEMATLSPAQLAGLDSWFELGDLPGLAADVPTARKQADGYRERAASVLRERGRLRLLAVGSEQALALYCRNTLVRLSDLRGRNVATDSPMTAALLEALGAVVQQLPASATREALATGRADCSVGGAMAGNLAGWAELTTHLFAMPLGWRLSHVVIAEAAWSKLDPATRQWLLAEYRRYEAAVWNGASVFTREGINCNAGVEPCKLGRKARMNIVLGSEADRALLGRLMVDTVLRSWSARCGRDCISALNDAVLRPAGLKPIP